MKKTLNSQLKRYYRKVTRIIPKKYPHRKEILSSIQQDISSYLEEHPDISYEDILKHFGTPEEMASSFVESLTPDDILTTSKKNRKLFIIIASAIAIFICFATIYIYLVIVATPVTIEDTVYVYPEVEIEDTQQP